MKKQIALLGIFALLSCTEGGLMVTDPNVSSSTDLGGSQSNLSSSGTSSETISGQSSETSSDGSSSSGDVNVDVSLVGPDPIDNSISQTIPLKIEAAASTLEMGETYCSGGILDVVWGGLSHYQVQPGKLLIWGEGECAATVFNGSSSGLEGFWSSNGAQALAPGSLDAYCDISSGLSDVYATYKFTSTSIIATLVQPDWCWSTEKLAYLDSFGSPVAHGCNSFSTSELGETATFTLLSFDPSTNAKKQTFSYNGQTCTVNTPGTVLNATTCSQAWDAYQSSSSSYDFYWDEWVGLAEAAAYEECVAATGWTGYNGL
jgi:hypothetical protein